MQVLPESIPSRFGPIWSIVERVEREEEICLKFCSTVDERRRARVRGRAGRRRGRSREE